MLCEVLELELQGLEPISIVIWLLVMILFQLVRWVQYFGLITLLEFIAANWPDLLTAIQIVVMGFLTFFLVIFTKRQTKINKVSRETRLLATRVRAVDDNGTDRFHLRLSNSGGGAARNLEVAFGISDLICMEYDQDGNPVSEQPIRTGTSVLPENYDLDSNKFDLNRVYEKETDADDDGWIPTAGNNIQGNEMDVLFEFVANVHLSSSKNTMNFRSALQNLSNVELDRYDLIGFEMTLTLDYEGEIDSPESITLIKYVVPIEPGLTLEDALKQGMPSTKFDQDPSRLRSNTRFSRS